MIKTIFIYGLLMSAPLAILGLKCYVTNTAGTSTLTDCASSDEVCGIVKSKYPSKVIEYIFSCEEAALEGQMLVCLFEFCPQN